MPTKRIITAQDLYQFQMITGTRISPDGEHVVYAVQRVDAKTEKKYANLWVATAAGNQPADRSAPARQFTYGDQNDTHPRWSPDGQWIAFLSNRGNKEKPAQIYLIPFRGGEARPLTEFEGRIDTFAWSPDGTRLLMLATKTDAEALEREKDEQKKKLGVVARHYHRLFYKLDGFGYLPQERHHLWTVDTLSGTCRQLTDHPIFDEQFPAWSPDGREIAFISNRSDDPDSTINHDEIYLIPADGGAMRKFDAPPGPKQQLSFSPDGRWIAYYGHEGEDEG